MDKIKRCPKHYWVKETVRAVMNLKLYPGGLNYVWPEFKVEICGRCNKIRNDKTQEQNVRQNKRI